MPTYSYRCKKCGKRFEKDMPISQHESHPRPKCPKCESRSVIQVPSTCQVVTSSKV